ncbi:type I 3-dehydroquinate dehydratase [Streptococcus sp. H49]|uniref:type I 3-dehydroquinate dehydratase n=1 Tax=Streptococcus huangxiaojuni TaxID=3237239 RepID=UPI0034A44EF3
MSTVTVENVVFGQGRPKIIVPIVEVSEAAILTAAKEAHDLDCDLVEWRIDWYDKVTQPGAVSALSKKVKEALAKPLLVTFRTKKEGGELELPEADYFAIYHDLLENGAADLLDLELFTDEDKVAETIAFAHEKGVKIVMCNHDFFATPSQTEIVSRLKAMDRKGGDICKIAVMPQTDEDVLTLLAATAEAKKTIAKPLITMSMGALGMVSRVSGEVFGSAATFGAAKQASAPGQVPVGRLREILDTLKLAE